MTANALHPFERNRTLPGALSADGLEEPVRALLRRLAGYSGDIVPPPRTIGFSGCSGGEGVSTVAARLAAEAAIANRGPVLLVDAHLARPAAHKLLEVRATPGLAEALSDDAEPTDLFQSCSVAGLYVLAAGQSRVAPTAVNDSPVLPDLLKFLREEFALVVFDLPPAAQLGHPPGLASLLDGLVLVAEAERTPQDLLRKHKEQLDGQSRILGVVLNKRRRYAPAWLGRLF